MACSLKSGASFIVLLIILLCPIVSSAASHQWIIGTWELFHDPDGDDTDWIEFSDSGQVTSFAVNKTRRVIGTYEVDSNGVRIKYKLRGQIIPVDLTYHGDKSALYAFSHRTGNTATYKKKP